MLAQLVVLVLGLFAVLHAVVAQPERRPPDIPATLRRKIDMEWKRFCYECMRHCLGKDGLDRRIGDSPVCRSSFGDGGSLGF